MSRLAHPFANFDVHHLHLWKNNSFGGIDARTASNDETIQFCWIQNNI